MFENREGSRMARFFFHVKNDSTFKEEEGENYPNLETARAHAAKIASELAKETGYEGFALSVTDEQGNEVAYMPDRRGRQLRRPYRALGSGGRSSATVFGRWLHLATCLSGETQLLSGARVYSNCFARFIPH
jgi:hypothetical protein